MEDKLTTTRNILKEWQRARTEERKKSHRRQQQRNKWGWNFFLFCSVQIFFSSCFVFTYFAFGVCNCVCICYPAVCHDCMTQIRLRLRYQFACAYIVLHMLFVFIAKSTIAKLKSQLLDGKVENLFFHLFLRKKRNPRLIRTRSGIFSVVFLDIFSFFLFLFRSARQASTCTYI